VYRREKQKAAACRREERFLSVIALRRRALPATALLYERHMRRIDYISHHFADYATPILEEPRRRRRAAAATPPADAAERFCACALAAQ